MNQPVDDRRSLPTWARELDTAVQVVSALCLLAGISADAAQRWVLPIGALLALNVAMALAWRALRGRVDRVDRGALVAGAAGGVLLVVVQWQLQRIPGLSSCPGCLARHAWHAVALNFVYGFGWLSTAWLVVRSLRRRPAARAGTPSI